MTDPFEVRSYGSFEEMQEEMATARAAAIANLTPSQRAIMPGDYAVNIQFLDNPDIGPIFGAVQSVAELIAWHRLFYGLGSEEEQERDRGILAERGCFKPPREASPNSWKDEGHASAVDAIGYYVNHHLEQHADGYLFGWWFSAIEDGELGSNHASVCVPIDRETFEDARAHEARIHTASADKIAAAMRRVVAEYGAREGQNTEGEGDDQSGL